MFKELQWTVCLEHGDLYELSKHASQVKTMSKIVNAILQAGSDEKCLGGQELSMPFTSQKTTVCTVNS